MNDCVFCKRIRNHEFDRQWTDAVAFQPLNPVTPGHMLVVSRQHVADAASNAIVAAVTMEAAARLAQEIGECNIITSIGPKATQTIFHLHIHVVPRRENDGLKLPWTDQVIIPDREINIGVHETHCCSDHGCKYGDGHRCPVYNGSIKQRYPCEFCGDEDVL